MELKEINLTQYKKFVVNITADELKERKRKKYLEVKDSLKEVDGFRRGMIPQQEAERIFGANNLYVTVIDDLFFEVLDSKEILTTKYFKVSGSFDTDDGLQIEFVAEMKPSIEIPDLKTIDVKYKEPEITDVEINEHLEKELKNRETFEDSTKQIAEIHDMIEIDFSGRLEGTDKPFKGGTTTNFKIKLKELENSPLIGDFEDKIVGMNVGEKRDIRVKFPDLYRDRNLQGKWAIFTTTLKSIKIAKDFTIEELMTSKGYSDLDEFKIFIKNMLLNEKRKAYVESFKKHIVRQIIDNTDLGGIPYDVVNEDVDSQWIFFLQRIGKTEEEYIKENKNGKEVFNDRMFQVTAEKIITTLILKEIAKSKSVSIVNEDVDKYINDISKMLNYDAEKIEKIKTDIKNNRHEGRFIKDSVLINKTLDYLVELFKGV